MQPLLPVPSRLYHMISGYMHDVLALKERPVQFSRPIVM